MPESHVMDLRELGDEFVIHYGGRLNEVNAYTFANSLVSLANSMRATNAIVNPGHDIEISIQAVGAGSFRAKLRATRRALGNLFSLQGAGTGLIGGLLATQIWEATHPNQPPKIIINDGSITFKYNDATIILPRAAYEPYEATRDSKDVRNAIANAFSQLDKDESITEFGIAQHIEDSSLLVAVPRQKFATIAGSIQDDQTAKISDERASVQVIRAILEQSKRLWEFVWKGNRISAPVVDQEFYASLSKRKITLAIGDILDVTLRIKQVPIGETGIYENAGYEVVKVHKHTPRPQQLEN